jgi:phosphatidylinositol alpha-mannosyltransferase
MKVALVSPYDIAYPGGVVSHILALERQLIKMGHQVRIIAPASKKILPIGDSFIPIGRARTIPVSGTVIRISISLRLASRIKEVLDEEKFDIIHLHEPFMPMLCSAVLRFSDAVNIGTFHACQSSPGYNFGWRGDGVTSSSAKSPCLRQQWVLPVNMFPVIIILSPTALT